MAIARGGVRKGNVDVRVSLSKKRSKAMLRKLGILPPLPEFNKDANGEVQLIRTIVNSNEGFNMPCNFQITFKMPAGLEQPQYSSGTPFQGGGWNSRILPDVTMIKGGGLDWKSHVMNKSRAQDFLESKDKVKKGFQTTYKPKSPAPEDKAAAAVKGFLGTGAEGGDGGSDKIPAYQRTDTLLDLYCSKVTIPEKVINFALYRNGNSHTFPFPQSVTYGTLTTTFYCDAIMSIKSFFDQWQKLIYNDITGNMNFLMDYESEIDIFTRSTLQVASDANKPPGPLSFADKISEGIKSATKAINDFTGMPPGKKENQKHEELAKSKSTLSFAKTYGVKVFQCWPAVVGGIDLGHEMTDQISTFDVTWAYTRWNPFKMGNVGSRGQVINLSVGELRNEKDGFPFLEDLPEELSGPLTGAAQQGVNTSPAAKGSNLFG